MRPSRFSATTVVPEPTIEFQVAESRVVNRPEVAARTANVAESDARLREEHWRPLFPFLSVGFSAGSFGGGGDQADTHFGHFSSRTDFDVLAVWSLDNLGFGSLCEQRRLNAELNEAFIERVRVMDQIRREVAEALALSSARRQEVDVARRRIETAERAFRLDLDRSRNLQGRPIEVLNSLNLLNTARQDLIRATVGYNQTQFQLFVALGQLPILALSITTSAE